MCNLTKLLKLGASLAALFVMLCAIGLVAQAPTQFSMSNPGGTLATCPIPAKGSNIFCSVAGDSANPSGYYASYDGTSYVLLNKPQAFTLPSSFTCTASAQISATSQQVTLSGCK